MAVDRGDFAQPTGYVRDGPPPYAPEEEFDAYARRNQCFCHGARGKPDGWIYHHDPNPSLAMQYAYVLGDTAMTVDIPGTHEGEWWRGAEVAWEQPPPDWEHLHQHACP